MALRRRRRYEMKAMDQIDMTPLLDLTFLLLIVFMISMPLMEYGTKIEPPAMNSDELPLDNIKSVSITGGSILVPYSISGILIIKTISRRKVRSSNGVMSI